MEVGSIHVDSWIVATVLWIALAMLAIQITKKSGISQKWSTVIVAWLFGVLAWAFTTFVPTEMRDKLVLWVGTIVGFAVLAYNAITAAYAGLQSFFANQNNK